MKKEQVKQQQEEPRKYNELGKWLREQNRETWEIVDMEAVLK